MRADLVKPLCVAALLVTATTAAAFDPALMREQPAIGAQMSQMVSGQHQVTAHDLDGDGGDELLIVPSFGFGVWPLSLDATTGEPRQLWLAPTWLVRGYDVGDVDLDGDLELVLLHGDGRIAVHDARTGVEVAAQTGPLLRSWQDVAIADVDPSPGAELLIVGGRDIEVYALGDPSPLWSIPIGNGMQRILIGDVDTDPALEALVSGSSEQPLVVDLGTRSIEWTLADAWSYDGFLADLDGDPELEIVGFRQTDLLAAYDADTQTRLWVRTDLDPYDVAVGDLDGDGIAEIALTSRSSSATVILVEGPTGAVMRTLDQPTLQWTEIGVGDLDGDCIGEIYLDDGTFEPARLLSPFGDLEWLAPEYEQAVSHTFAAGDIDGDGRTDVIRPVVASDETRVERIDVHHQVQLTASPEGQPTAQDVVPIELAPLDGDAALEYILGVGNGQGVSAYDGVTDLRQWQTDLPAQVSAIATGDVDGGGLDVVVGTWSGSGASELHVLDSDGNLSWTAPLVTATGAGVFDIRVAQLDADPAIEIAFRRGSDGFYVVDGTSRLIDWSDLDPGYESLDIGDVDDDFEVELVVGDRDGWLSAHDVATRTQLFRESIGDGPIRAIRVADLDADGESEIVLTIDGLSDPPRPMLRILRGRDRKLLWEKAIDHFDGANGNLQVVEIDDDGSSELVLGTAAGIRVFEHGLTIPDTTAPVFDGTIGLQSAVAAPHAPCCAAVDLVWELASDDVSPPVRYRLYRDTVAGFTPSPGNRVAETPFASHRDPGVTAEQTYYYLVHAVDLAGNEDGNTVERSVTLPAIDDPLPAPLGNVLRAVAPGPWDVELSWSGGPLHRLYRDVERTTPGATPLGPDTSAVAYSDIDALLLGDSFYYQVRALSTCSHRTGP